jgi:hypothetical protein
MDMFFFVLWISFEYLNVGLSSSLSTGVVSKVVSIRSAQHYHLSGTMEAGNTDIPVMLQTTAAVHPGASGGVLINSHGQMVGLITRYKKKLILPLLRNQLHLYMTNGRPGYCAVSLVVLTFCHFCYWYLPFGLKMLYMYRIVTPARGQWHATISSSILVARVTPHGTFPPLKAQFNHLFLVLSFTAMLSMVVETQYLTWISAFPANLWKWSFHIQVLLNFAHAIFCFNFSHHSWNESRFEYIGIVVNHLPLFTENRDSTILSQLDKPNEVLSSVWALAPASSPFPSGPPKKDMEGKVSDFKKFLADKQQVLNTRDLEKLLRHKISSKI